MASNFAPSAPLLTNILLIDDDVHDLKLWAHNLQGFEKYRIIAAMSGREGLDLCTASDIDCIVLDLDLDRESGFEVLLGLCRGSQRPRVPVGILTKMFSPNLHDMALHIGASFWLQKGQTSAADLDRAIQQAITASIKQLIFNRASELPTWLDPPLTITEVVHPDCIVLDFKLVKDPSGFKVLRALLGREHPPRRAVIVLTGLSKPIFEHGVLALGAAGFLEKNKTDAATLDSAIRQTMAIRRGQF